VHRYTAGKQCQDGGCTGDTAGNQPEDGGCAAAGYIVDTQLIAERCTGYTRDGVALLGSSAGAPGVTSPAPPGSSGGHTRVWVGWEVKSASFRVLGVRG
jgi:hypothetical protein